MTIIVNTILVWKIDLNMSFSFLNSFKIEFDIINMSKVREIEKTFILANISTPSGQKDVFKAKIDSQA